jgi:hypothetical protein
MNQGTLVRWLTRAVFLATAVWVVAQTVYAISNISVPRWVTQVGIASYALGIGSLFILLASSCEADSTVSGHTCPEDIFSGGV